MLIVAISYTWSISNKNVWAELLLPKILPSESQITSSSAFQRQRMFRENLTPKRIQRMTHDHRKARYGGKPTYTEGPKPFPRDPFWSDRVFSDGRNQKGFRTWGETLWNNNSSKGNYRNKYKYWVQYKITSRNEIKTSKNIYRTCIRLDQIAINTGYYPLHHYIPVTQTIYQTTTIFVQWTCSENIHCKNTRNLP